MKFQWSWIQNVFRLISCKERRIYFLTSETKIKTLDQFVISGFFMSFKLGSVVSGNSMIIHIREDFSANF